MLTVTIIAKNEETNLRRLLPTISAARQRPGSVIGEVVVLDSGSGDATRAVTESHSARWAERPFDGFGTQKRAATALASHDWILNLDADEVPSAEFWENLERFIKNPNGYFAATLARDFVFLGRTLRFGGASEQRRIRIFHRDHFDWNSAAVHEDVVPKEGRPGSVGHVAGQVLHYSWNSIQAFLDATNRRSSVQAAEKANGSAVGMILGITARPVAEFLRSYLLRLGCLDGLPGFCFCYLMAFSQTLKYLKAYERRVAAKPTQA
jgi:glycosyltransferase involved in cell wall biosynthesis